MPRKKAEPETALVEKGANNVGSLSDAAGFELIQRVATAFSKSTLVPTQYRENLPNCIIALDMANRLGASTLQVMQNLYVVQGRPAWSAKFLISSFNGCGRFSAIRYEWQGEHGGGKEPNANWGCRAYATELKTGEIIHGPWITMALVKLEGWYGKSGSKWQTIPELMFMYRAAAWLVNTHAPELSMGLNAAEELGDVVEMAPGPGGSFQVEQATAEKQAELRTKYRLTPQEEEPARETPVREPGDDETETPELCCPGAPHQHVDGCPNG